MSKLNLTGCKRGKGMKANTHTCRETQETSNVRGSDGKKDVKREERAVHSCTQPHGVIHGQERGKCDGM